MGKNQNHVWEETLNFITNINGAVTNFPEENFDFSEIKTSPNLIVQRGNINDDGWAHNKWKNLGGKIPFGSGFQTQLSLLHVK